MSVPVKADLCCDFPYKWKNEEMYLLAERPENPSAEAREAPLYATKGSLDVKTRGMIHFAVNSQSRFAEGSLNALKIPLIWWRFW